MNKNIARPQGEIIDSLCDQGATDAEIADIVNAPTGRDAWDKVFQLAKAISVREGPDSWKRRRTRTPM